VVENVASQGHVSLLAHRPRHHLPVGAQLDTGLGNGDVICRHNCVTLADPGQDGHDPRVGAVALPADHHVVHLADTGFRNVVERPAEEVDQRYQLALQRTANGQSLPHRVANRPAPLNWLTVGFSHQGFPEKVRAKDKRRSGR